MKKIDIKNVDSRISPAKERRELADHLDADNVAVNYYFLEPDDKIGFGYHAHEKQEEIFYVQSGSVTFETEDGEVEVGSGELIRFSPGEYQLGFNNSDSDAEVLAIGSPKDESQVKEVLKECQNCGERTPQSFDFSSEHVITSCSECGEETGRYT